MNQQNPKEFSAPQLAAGMETEHLHNEYTDFWGPCPNAPERSEEVYEAVSALLLDYGADLNCQSCYTQTSSLRVALVMRFKGMAQLILK